MDNKFIKNHRKTISSSYPYPNWSNISVNKHFKLFKPSIILVGGFCRNTVW